MCSRSMCSLGECATTTYVFHFLTFFFLYAHFVVMMTMMAGWFDGTRHSNQCDVRLTECDHEPHTKEQRLCQRHMNARSPSRWNSHQHSNEETIQWMFFFLPSHIIHTRTRSLMCRNDNEDDESTTSSSSLTRTSLVYCVQIRLTPKKQKYEK